jgi:hypothetical protein
MPPGAGMFTAIGQLLIGLLVWPFQFAARRLQKARTLEPLEKELRRAARGAAVLVLSTWFAVWALWPVWLADLRGPGFDTSATLWLLLYVALTMWGLSAFLVGANRSNGARDGMKAFLAIINLAIGVGLVVGVVILFPPVHAFEGASPSQPARSAHHIAMFCTLAFPVWLTVTGLVRFVLLTFSGAPAARLIARYQRRRARPMRFATERRRWFNIFRRGRNA